MSWRIVRGDCVEQMRSMEPCSVDSVVCDPPYGIGFMGKEWDGPAIAEAARLDRERRKSLGPASPSRPGRAEPRSSSAFGNEAIIAGPVRGGLDFQHWCEAWATEALRVLKPGGYLLAFGGTRTYHRLAAGVEDAGFEIRDTICWLYGSGFPKSLDVSKAIDRQRDDSQARGDVAEWLRPHVEAHGFEAVTEHFGFKDQTMVRARWTTRSQPQTPTLPQWAELKSLLGLPDDMDAEVWRLNGRKGQPGEAWETAELLAIDERMNEASGIVAAGRDERTPVAREIKAPNSPEAERWQGFGTALKPSHEPIVVARKPLTGTVAQTVLEHGTGALNVDGCRVGTGEDKGLFPDGRQVLGRTSGPLPEWQGAGERRPADVTTGRWPANCVLTHSEGCAVSSGQWPTLDEWEPSLNLCALCAEDAVRSTRHGTPGTDVSTAPSDAALTSSAKDAPTPSDISRTVTGCSAGPNPEAPSTDRTAASSSSTGESGRTPTDPSPTGSSSTTSMETNSTTESGTCNSCGAPSTTRITTRASLSDRDSRGCVSDCPVRLLDEQTGRLVSGDGNVKQATGADQGGNTSAAFGAESRAAGTPMVAYGDSGGASRFFYVAKASRGERNAGLEGFEESWRGTLSGGTHARQDERAGRDRTGTATRNSHPTVKPIELMRWLVRLVCPPGGTVLDPFAGSGTTGIAAVLENFDFIGIEREDEYADIAEARIGWWEKHRGDGQAAAVLAAGEVRDAVEATGQLELGDAA